MCCCTHWFGIKEAGKEPEQLDAGCSVHPALASLVGALSVIVSRRSYLFYATIPGPISTIGCSGSCSPQSSVLSFDTCCSTYWLGVGEGTTEDSSIVSLGVGGGGRLSRRKHSSLVRNSTRLAPSYKSWHAIADYSHNRPQMVQCRNLEPLSCYRKRWTHRRIHILHTVVADLRVMQPYSMVSGVCSPADRFGQERVGFVMTRLSPQTGNSGTPPNPAWRKNVRGMYSLSLEYFAAKSHVPIPGRDNRSSYSDAVGDSSAG
jgi:hypothetical protein